MFKKRFVTLFVGIICLVLLHGSVVFASAESYKSYSSVYNDEEYGEVLKAIEESDTLGEIPKEFYAASRDKDTVKYKTYKLSQPDIAVQLSKGKTVADCLSTDYLWIVEVPGKLFSVVKDNDGWRAVGYQYLDSEKSKEGLIDTAVLERNDIVLPQTKSAQNPPLLFFEAPMYFTNFIYYKSNGTEYLIPYSSRPDLTRLENGKVYTAKEAAVILIESFGGSGSPDGIGGGVSPVQNLTAEVSQNNLKSNISLKIATPVFAVITAAFIFAVVLKNKKGNQEN